MTKCPPKTPCDKDKICNPPTGRCVLKTGAIGKSLEGNKNNAIDPVTMDPIEPHRRVVANRQAYNVHSLAEIVHRGTVRDPTFGLPPARLPHSRRVVTPEEAARWTAHARHTGWAPAAGAQMTNENRRIPDHLRAAAVAAELARRQQLERQIGMTASRFIEEEEASELPRVRALVNREVLPQDSRVYRYLLEPEEFDFRYRTYSSGDWTSEAFAVLEVFTTAHTEDSVYDFMYSITGFYDPDRYSRHVFHPAIAWFTRIVDNLYEYYKNNNPGVQDGINYNTTINPKQIKIKIIKDDYNFQRHHRALESRLTQYFDPLRRQIQAMPVISQDAIYQLLGNFAARHPVFTLPG